MLTQHHNSPIIVQESVAPINIQIINKAVGFAAENYKEQYLQRYKLKAAKSKLKHNYDQGFPVVSDRRQKREREREEKRENPLVF